jgi:alanine-glyoxylate transaminase/serine-glyoxylate transaminase/serine-pyruvate transaminase
MFASNPVFIPGPTNIPERLLRAMAAQTVDHRSPAFSGLMASIKTDLRRALKSREAEIAIFPASGTGGWEAAVANTLSPGDTVLAARHGMFSTKWINLCEGLGLTTQVIERPWGEGAPAALIGAALAGDPEHRIKAVLVTHNETATGVRSDVAAVRRAIDDAGHPALLLVDGVSSIASMDFRFDEWGVDVAVTGSQKGFMLHTGLAIAAFSPKAWALMDGPRLGRGFFDLRDMAAAVAKGGYPYTPAYGLMLGLRESLTMLLEEEGLEAVFARHRRIADGVRAAVGAWGFRLAAAAPDLYSDTVSTIMVPEGFDSDALTAHAYKAYGMSFGVGLGVMAGKAFRIGHLGAMTDATALSGLATIEMAMKDLGYPITLGAGVAAAQDSYRASHGATQAKAA